MKQQLPSVQKKGEGEGTLLPLSRSMSGGVERVCRLQVKRCS
jgi:hypothetical protein